MDTPPYSLTPEILSLIIEIAEKTGQINAQFLEKAAIQNLPPSGLSHLSYLY